MKEVNQDKYFKENKMMEIDMDYYDKKIAKKIKIFTNL
ncbi:hypothetical protein C8K15_101403 [Paenisporosarcina sp. OV554]|nr:hypothetical protein C8K15_101403 [Paenisporosarcina sp. OV554]